MLYAVRDFEGHNQKIRSEQQVAKILTAFALDKAMDESRKRKGGAGDDEGVDRSKKAKVKYIHLSGCL